MEIWKDIKGYEGKYQVSNMGRVRSLDRFDRVGNPRKGRLLNPKPKNNGYVRVHLADGKGYAHESVHRLVAEAFVERRNPEDIIVNHLDNNPTNNRADNLEWTTYQGNMQWAAKQGRMKGCPTNLLKAREVLKKPVIAIDKDGNRIWFASQAEAARVLGLNSGHIAHVCRKEYGYNQTGGYEFEYADAEYQKTVKPKRVAMSEEERWKQHRERMKGNKYSLGRKPSAKCIQTIREIHGKPILQYDRDGNFIKEYACCMDAEREIGVRHAYDVANGKRKTAGGYVWRWKGENK